MSNAAKTIGAIDLGDIFGDAKISSKPKGYHFVKEIAAAASLSYSHTSRKLSNAFEEGQIERVMVLVRGHHAAAYKVKI